MDQCDRRYIGKGIMEEIGIAKTQKSFSHVAVFFICLGLVLAGVIGLFLPLLPGSVLVIAGVLVLSGRFSWLRGKVERCRPRFPLVERARERLSAWYRALRTRVKNDFADFGSQPRTLYSARFQNNENSDEKLDTMPKVLIFDEDAKDLVWHAEPFEAHGFEVYKCMSIETAMRCVEREEFDFAVVDQVSPAFEGRRVLRHLMRYNSRRLSLCWRGAKPWSVTSKQSRSEQWTIGRSPSLVHR